MTDKLKPAGSVILALAALLTVDSGQSMSQSDSLVVLDRNSTRLLPMAKSYLKQGNSAAARNLLETMLQLHPSDAETHLLLGQSYALNKQYAKARQEYSQCLRCRDQIEIARSANQLMLKLPRRHLHPRRHGSLAHSTLDKLSTKDCLLFFFAHWDARSIELKEIAESATANSPKLMLKTFDVGDPQEAQVFDLYKVSAIPTVVMLSKGNQHVVASLVGNFSKPSLRNLIDQHDD